VTNLRVLIVNDEMFILQAMVEIVKKLNIKDIDQAQNGFTAYQMVLKKQYDIVLCDLNMPVLNGY
jgi:YesN/AraC family two-component response regulator